jgi:hypothetical protein
MHCTQIPRSQAWRVFNGFAIINILSFSFNRSVDRGHPTLMIASMLQLSAEAECASQACTPSVFSPRDACALLP